MTDNFYLDSLTNKISAFPADGSLDSLIPSTSTLITRAQVDIFLATPKTLTQAQSIQNSALLDSYKLEIQMPVAYMGTTFQADPDSQDTLNKVIVASGSYVPAGFYWVDANNNKVAMNFSQLQELGATILAQGWAAFQHLQDKKSAVRSATTIQQVQAISW